MCGVHREVEGSESMSAHATGATQMVRKQKKSIKLIFLIKQEKQGETTSSKSVVFGE